MELAENTPDFELLRTFAETGSEEAFTALVHRHVGLVYSAALRQLRDSHLAEDVTQAVFVLLARKAASIREGTILAGWLYRAAQFTANDVLKSEARRRKREESSAEPAPAHASAGLDSSPPSLDHALEQLSEMDRNAILLRYFEERSLREVGQALGISEDAARKRVDRAVEKLREFLPERNAALAPGMLGAGAPAILPAGLGLRAATAALAGTTGLNGSVLELVRGALQAMLLRKVKQIVGAFAGAALLLLLAAELSRPALPKIAAREVFERHLAQSNPESLRSDMLSERAGTSCMSCHRPESRLDTSSLVQEIVLEGDWSETLSSETGKFRLRFGGAARVLEEITVEQFGKRERGWNGSAGWESIQQEGARALTPNEKKRFQMETSILLWPGQAPGAEWSEPKEFQGNGTYAVPSPEGTRFFDAQTGLLTATTWTLGAPGTNIVEDYKRTGGLFAPRRFSRIRPNSREVFVVRSIRVSKASADIFDPPGERKRWWVRPEP
jgi:RNA polymerase sigma factor (sigma-70 family)